MTVVNPAVPVDVLGNMFRANGAGAAITTGTNNITIGNQAGAAITTGQDNIAIGRLALLTQTTQNASIAIGLDSLAAHPGGVENVCLGNHTDWQDTAGTSNTVVGASAMYNNSTGQLNTAIGADAFHCGPGTGLFGTGNNNVAVGYQALYGSTAAVTAHDNVAVGLNALFTVTSDQFCVAVGELACNLSAGSTGLTAVGYNALASITGVGATGAGGPTAVGYYALNGVTTGNNNTALGQVAGFQGNGVGGNKITTGSGNTMIGAQTGPNAGTLGAVINSTALGFNAQVGGNNAVALGAACVAGAAGAVAIGRDNSNASANTTTANVIALGTALHQIQISNNTTGAGTPAFSNNSPAVTPGTIYTWLKLMAGDGSTIFVPAWK